MSRPHASGLATLADGNLTQIFVAHRHAESGRLVTLQLREEHEEGGTTSIEALKTVDWHSEVPESLALFAASGGLLRDTVGIYWAGWIETRAINALSLFQERPIRLELVAGETLAGQPIIGGSQRMYQFSWRPEEAGAALWSHAFSGELERSGVVQSARIGESRLAPRATVSAAIPGASDDRAALGWTADSDAGLVVSAAHVIAGQVTVLESAPLAGLATAPRQRPALLVDEGEASPAVVGCVVRSVEGDAYLWVEVSFDFAAGSSEIARQPIAIEPGSLAAGAAVYLDDPEEPDARVLVRTSAGDLVQISPQTGLPRPFRSAAPADYDFPLTATFDAGWEIRLNSRGEAQIERLAR